MFKVSKVGNIAGCSVLKGMIERSAKARVIRDGEKIHSGKIVSLKRFKEDAKQVKEGFECGIGVSNFNDYKEGDIIEVFEIKKTARKLQ